MITGYVRREDFHKLTVAEARAFVLFELMEKKRHEEDIEVIESDIIEVRRIHKI